MSGGGAVLRAARVRFNPRAAAVFGAGYTILKLADKYSAERLENACQKALTYTPRPSLKNLQTILSSGQDKTPDEKRETEKKAESQYGFTRGADYYEGRMK